MTQGGIGPIPFSEMSAYMDAFGVHSPDNRDRFVKMMKALDRVYITHTNSKLKQERERRSKARPRRGRRAK